MLIDGVITDKKLSGEFIRLNVFPKIGIEYMSAKDFILGNNHVYLFLKELPQFNIVYDYFLSCSSLKLKKNIKQDICLSLFYNPYFNEFYTRVKNDANILSPNRKNCLIKNLLLYLSDSIQYQGIMKLFDSEKEHYLKYDIYNRSQELIQLLR